MTICMAFPPLLPTNNRNILDIFCFLVCFSTIHFIIFCWNKITKNAILCKFILRNAKMKLAFIQMELLFILTSSFFDMKIVLPLKRHYFQKKKKQERWKSNLHTHARLSTNSFFKSKLCFFYVYDIYFKKSTFYVRGNNKKLMVLVLERKEKKCIIMFTSLDGQITRIHQFCFLEALTSTFNF